MLHSVSKIYLLYWLLVMSNDSVPPILHTAGARLGFLSPLHSVEL